LRADLALAYTVSHPGAVVGLVGVDLGLAGLMVRQRAFGGVAHSGSGFGVDEAMGVGFNPASGDPAVDGGAVDVRHSGEFGLGDAGHGQSGRRPSPSWVSVCR
jgi:hypothetical protein